MSLNALIDIASSNNYQFTGASNDDVVVYTSSETQNILLGNKNNTNAALLLSTSNIALTLQSSNAANSISFNTNNGSTNALTITGTGNVGVGTATPSYSLEVYGTSSVLSAVATPTASWSAPHRLVNTYAANPGILSMLAPNVTTGNSALTYIGKSLTSGNAGQIHFTYVGDNDQSNMMSYGFYGVGGILNILKNGNIGIGTSTPAVTLDVNGTVRAATVNATTDLQVNGTSISTTYAPKASPVFTGVVSAPLGAVGAPTYTFTGDTNTGMWSPAADTVAVSTAGSERIRINSSGNIGIGTTTPQKSLHIFHSTAEIGLRIEGGSNGNSSNNPQFYLNAKANSPICMAYFKHPLYIGRSTNGGDVVNTTQPTIVCTTDDLVGIGTTTPSYKLDVNGTINATGLLINGTALSSATGGGFTASATSIAYTTCNVGIGTTTPSYGLDINSNCRVSGVFRAAQNVNNQVTIESDGAENMSVMCRQAGGTDTVVGKMQFDGYTNVDQSSCDIRFFTMSNSAAIAEQMVITKYGSVGIATSAPSALYKLDVNGAINATSINVSGTPISTGTGGGFTTAASSITYTSCNVGIGTATPSVRFHVYGGDALIRGANWSSNGHQAILSLGDTTQSVKSVYGMGIALEPNTTTLPFVVRQITGFVGAGTTAPWQRLHVVGSAYTDTSYIAPLGTVTAPSYTFSNDTNTGIWSPAADTIATSTGGSERMRIDAVGNVGIGTTSPTTFLHIVPTSTLPGTVATTTGSPTVTGTSTTFTTTFVPGDNITIGVNSYTVGVITSDTSLTLTSNALANASGSAYSTTTIKTGISVQRNANVGIGTTTAAEKLHVTGSTLIPYGASYWVGNNADSNARLRLHHNAGDAFIDYWSNLNFRAGASTPTSVTMYLSSNGNVGIGTSTPGSLLDVNGTMRATTINATTDLQVNGTSISTTYATKASPTFTGTVTAADMSVTGTLTVVNVTETNVTTSNITASNITSKGLILANTQVSFSNNSSQAAPSLGGNGGVGDRIILFKGDVATYPYSLGINASTFWSSVPTGAAYNWFINGTSEMYLNATGLGIGNVAPWKELHVTGSIFPTSTYIAPLGAAATPSITFSNDANTGIWSPAADTIAASTGGSERLRIDSTGNVGIGTTAPGCKLDVGGLIKNYSTNAVAATTGSMSVGVVVANGTNGCAINIGNRDTGSGSTCYGWIQTAYVNAMNMNTKLAINPNGGYVGIATTTPAYPLDVNGTIQATTVNATTDIQLNGTSISTTYAPSNTLSNYVLTTTANTTYAPSNIISNYVLTATANTTYAPSNTMSNYAPKASPTFTGTLSAGTIYSSNDIYLQSSGLSKFYFGTFGLGYLTEKWGMCYIGDGSTHPFSICNASLTVGFNTTNSNLGTGNLLVSNSVGIGSTAPVEKLDVTGNIACSGSLNLNKTYTANPTQNVLASSIYTYGMALSAGGTAGGSNVYAKYTQILGGDVSGIYHGGSPSVYGGDLLLKAGSVNLSGNNGSAWVNGYGGNVKFYPGYAYVSTNDAGSARYVESGRTVFYKANTNGTSIDTSYTEAACISKDGYVGIGTASPTVPLDVNGTIRATTINATTDLQVNGTSISTTYAPKASPTFTGTVTAADMSVTGTLTVVNVTETNVTTSNVTASNITSKGLILANTQVSFSNNSSQAAPSLGGNGGVGDRIILFKGDVAAYPYSLGINASTFWSSVPTGAAYNWFINGTSEMYLNATGLGIGNVAPWKELHVTGSIFPTSTYIAPLGAAATPSITFSNDANTGIWSPAADTVAVSTGGSERLRVDSSGNVGIGTSTALEKLHVNGSTFIPSGASYWIGNDADSNSRLRMHTAVGDAFIDYWSNLSIRYGSGSPSNITMYLSSNGNVGVGTNAPGYKLDVNGTFSATTINATANIVTNNLTSSSLVFNSLYQYNYTSNTVNIELITSSNYVNTPNAGGSNIYGKSFSLKTGDLTGSYWGGIPSLYGGDFVVKAGNVALTGNNGSAPVNGYGGNVKYYSGYAFVSDDSAGSARTVESGRHQFYTSLTNGISINTNYIKAFEIDNLGNGIFNSNLTVPYINANNISTSNVTSTGVVVTSLGAVGTPSYTFSNDANTGIWSPAADTVAVSTGGTERLRITSAGYVGIGSATPNCPLDVQNPGNGNEIIRIGTERPWVFKQNSVGSTTQTLLQSTTSDKSFIITSDTGFNMAQFYAHTTNTSCLIRMIRTSIGNSNVSPPTNGLYVEGNVGIGSSSPTNKVDIVGSVCKIYNGAGSASFVTSTTSGTYTLGTEQSANRFNINDGSSNVLSLFGSKVGIKTTTPSYDLHVTGVIAATQDVQILSDQRVKSNLEVISDSLNKVKTLTGYTFNMDNSDKRHAGLIAQDIEKVLPEVVSEDPNSGLKSLAYGNVVGLLVEAIKQVDKKLDHLYDTLGIEKPVL
jgi:fibronectin-binding autotransporter adhesin